MENKINLCIESILAQSYYNFELIIVNDGSTDNSLSVCEKYAADDERIKIYTTSNQGAGPARNLGILNASGKYIYFPDADDFLKVNALEVMVRAIEKKKSDLLVFGFICKDSCGNIIKTKKYQESTFDGEYVRMNYSDFYITETGNRIQGAPWNKLFVLSIIKNYHIQFPALRRHQDEAFIARYVSVIRNVTFIEDILYEYYLNDLLKEWDKYPLDYYQVVNALFEERKLNIMRWNPNDKKTHDMVYSEYICSYIKALELSFGSKFSFSKKERKEWIRKRIDESKIKEIKMPSVMHLYQKIIMFLIKENMISLLYLVMFLKIEIQKRKQNKNV